MVRLGVCAALAVAATAIGCGDAATTGTTGTAVPAGRLGATPPFAIRAPQQVAVRVGEPTTVPLTIVNNTRRVHTLTVQGRASAIDATMAPDTVTAHPLESAGVRMTLLAHAPAAGARLEIIVSPQGNLLQAVRATVSVDARPG